MDLIKRLIFKLCDIIILLTFRTANPVKPKKINPTNIVLSPSSPIPNPL